MFPRRAASSDARPAFRPLVSAITVTHVSWHMQLKLWGGRMGVLRLTHAEVFLGLRAHRPTPVAQVRRGLFLRWAMTLGMAGLLPLSLYMANTQSLYWSLSGWVLVALAFIGLMAVASGFIARRSNGLERDWGLAPLGDAAAVELTELSSRHAAIERLVDEWLDRWVCSGSVLRGEDLLRLRQYVRAYERTPMAPATVAAAQASSALATSAPEDASAQRAA